MGRIYLEEDLTMVKHEARNFSIIGGLVYSHFLRDKRKKVEAIVEKGIFVGYIEVSKSHRIYIPSPRKVVVRWDVIFKENKAFRRYHGLDAEETK